MQVPHSPENRHRPVVWPDLAEALLEPEEWGRLFAFAVIQHDPGIFWTKVDPRLRPLYADPRRDAFLRKLKLLD